MVCSAWFYSPTLENYAAPVLPKSSRRQCREAGELEHEIPSICSRWYQNNFLRFSACVTTCNWKSAVLLTILSAGKASSKILSRQRHRLLSGHMVLALPSLARVLALVNVKCCHMNSVLFSDHNFAIWQSLANDHLSQHLPKVTGSQAQIQQEEQCCCSLCDHDNVSQN